MKARQWYRMEAQADDPTVVDIQIVDFIGDWIDDYWGFGVTAKALLDQLSKLDAGVKVLRVHVNSPGGDCFAAVNIANALRDQRVSKGRAVTTIVDGLAASAASIVIMAGDRVEMSDNALIMIHNPWTVGVGNAADLRKSADTLDTVRDTLVATYRWHSTLSADALVAMMDAETWLDADQAIDAGLATHKVEGLRAAASIDRRAVDKLRVPEQYAARVAAWLTPDAEPHGQSASPDVPAAAAATDVLRLCREADCLDLAEGFITAQAPLTAVQASIAQARATRSAEQARAQAITDACALARLSDLAAEYIAGGMPADRVRAQLTRITARLEAGEIDGSLPPDRHPGGSRPVLDTLAIYTERNRKPQS